MELSRLKELTNLQLNEAAGFVLALLDHEHTVIGYFVADDEELTGDPKKAHIMTDKNAAAREEHTCNSTWDFNHGEKFKFMPLAAAPEVKMEI